MVDASLSVETLPGTVLSADLVGTRTDGPDADSYAPAVPPCGPGRDGDPVEDLPSRSAPAGRAGHDPARVAAAGVLAAAGSPKLSGFVAGEPSPATSTPAVPVPATSTPAVPVPAPSTPQPPGSATQDGDVPARRPAAAFPSRRQLRRGTATPPEAPAPAAGSAAAPAGTRAGTPAEPGDRPGNAARGSTADPAPSSRADLSAMAREVLSLLEAVRPCRLDVIDVAAATTLPRHDLHAALSSLVSARFVVAYQRSPGTAGTGPDTDIRYGAR